MIQAPSKLPAVVDLMATLAASVEQVEKAKKPPAKGKKEAEKPTDEAAA